MNDLRRFDPLTADSPVLNERCAACRQPFVVGDRVALVTIGPGEKPEAREKARAGRPYNAVAVPAHWACVTGEDL